MNELATYQGGLPDTIDDLARFIIIAQEKAKALRAEIRAIEKLELAKEVYDQKLREQARLNELVLVAKNRVGEFTKNLSTSAGGRPSTKTHPASGKSFPEKTKSQVVQELGFSTSQVHRFETMAAHPEIVDEVIAESKAGVTNATQGEVLRRIQEREQSVSPPVQNRVIDLAEIRSAKFHADMAQIGEDSKIHKKFLDAIYAPLLLPESSAEVVSATIRATEGKWESDFETLEMAIRKLQEIHILMRKEAYKHGKK